jgi:lanosterol synthase
MIQYYRVTRTPDGVWGLHPESQGYVFFTTLAYVALRLLDLPPDDPMLSTARHWLHSQKGGVLSIPTWGKFWLAVLGLYRYEGVRPILPELLLLPRDLPIHPHHYYCHTRLIYLAMAYLCGKRVCADLGPMTHALRSELYTQPYETIDFAAHRRDVAETDIYIRQNRSLRFVSEILRLYDQFHLPSLRRRALDECLKVIVTEQRSTQHQALSPVNGLLNCLALWATDPRHPDLAPSLQGVDGWKWQDEAEGIRYVGARSHTWDTAFAIQALLDASPIPLRV